MMPPTMRNTQLTGWLRKTPMRDRLHAEASGAGVLRVVSGVDTNGSS